jgi:hypothetical protein
MQNYIIIAQSILEGGRLGKIKEAQTIAAPSPTEALAAFQYDTLRGRGSYLNDDHDTLHWDGIQFTAVTDDEFHDMQGDEDESDGIEDFDCLEDALDAGLDDIEERLARLKEVGQ